MPSLIKQRPPSSLPLNLRDSTIDFKHPHYSDDFDQNIIFSLQAYDVWNNANGTTGRGGLHYGTALLACSIVAGNVWNGYFTLDKGGTKLDIGDDQLLTDSAYFFHVPTATETSANYAIYPCFQEWAFPHHNLPAGWTRPTGSTDHPNVPSPRSNVTAAVLQRDSTCLVTGQRDYMERAHLCPYSERKWFTNNHMSRYNANQKLPPDQSTDDVSNAIALRCDIHSAFDDCTFAIVPKQGSWVPHFFAATHDLGRQYHNIPLKLDNGISAHHLLTRFAWTIFPWVQVFLLTGGKRTVRFHVLEEDGHKEKTEIMSADSIKARFFDTKARDHSEKKRKATDNPQEDCEGDEGRDTKRRRHSDHADDFSRGMSDDAACTSDSSTLAEPSSDDKGPVNVLILPHGVESAEDTAVEGERAWQAGEEAFDQYIERIRRRELLKMRPTDLGLYCCDYNRADALTRKGIRGRREWGGSHLCDECLGGEYLQVAEDLEEADGAKG